MKILVTNVYSYENKGDAAIVICMLEDLICQLKPISITISSTDPKDNHHYGDYETLKSLSKVLHEQFDHGQDFIGRLMFCLRFLLFKVQLLLFWFSWKLNRPVFGIFSPPVGAKVRSYVTCDIVVACGGGYLVTNAKTRRLESIFGCDEITLLCNEFSLGTIFKKPLIMYHQSVGPFADSAQQSVVRKHLEPARAVFCRELLTFERVSQLGLSNGILSSDIAFKLNGEKIYEHRIDDVPPDVTRIGITVRNCFTGGSQQSYEAEVAKFMESLLMDSPRTIFYFMPQVTYSRGKDDDTTTATAVVLRLPSYLREKAIVITGNFSPMQLKGLIGKMTYFVGTRMHSNIFALSSEVKTLAISYEPKTKGIMDSLGLSEYVVDGKGIQAKQLLCKFKQLVEDQTYLQRLKVGLSILDRRLKTDIYGLVASR